MTNADEFSPDSIKSIMRKVARYTFTAYGGGTAAGINENWDGGTIMTGITGLYLTTREQQWLDSIDKWGNRWNWTWGGGTGDNLCCIQTFCERYIVDSVPANAAKYQVSKTALDGILKSPVNHLFGWQDAVYMGLPDFSMMGDITGIPMYFDSLNSMFRGAENDFEDTTYKLWYWNTLPSFKKTLEGYPQFWGPGNAWVIGGMVRALKYMPANSKYRPAWEATFKTFCDTIRSKQQSDGMWRTSLFEPTEFPDPEAGSTSLFAYAFSLGVDFGILDANVYIPVIRKAWSALVNCVDATGKVQRCQPWSNQPGGVGLNNTPEGQGEFLLAGEGVSLMVALSTRDVPLQPGTGVCLKPVAGVCKLMMVPGGGKTVRVAAGSRGLEVYSACGARLWQCDAASGEDVLLPGWMARGVVCFVKYLR